MSSITSLRLSKTLSVLLAYSGHRAGEAFRGVRTTGRSQSPRDAEARSRGVRTTGRSQSPHDAEARSQDLDRWLLEAFSGQPCPPRTGAGGEPGCRELAMGSDRAATQPSA